MKNNIMIVNDEDVGVRKIELDGTHLVISSKVGYILTVYIGSYRKDIDDMKVGEKRKIVFSEYYIMGKNGAMLVNPTKSIVEMVEDNKIVLELGFTDFRDAVHMYSREKFEVSLRNIIVKVCFDNRDIEN